MHSNLLIDSDILERESKHFNVILQMKPVP